jgi:hypothetical protein
MAATKGHPPAQLWQCQHWLKLTPERCLTSFMKLESIRLMSIRFSVVDVAGFSCFMGPIFIQSRSGFP